MTLKALMPEWHFSDTYTDSDTDVVDYYYWLGWDAWVVMSDVDHACSASSIACQSAYEAQAA